MGTEITNPTHDNAKKLACLLNFLMPPFALGNQPGDVDRWDPEGQMIIVKEEPVSDMKPITNTSGDPTTDSEEEEGGVDSGPDEY